MTTPIIATAPNAQRNLSESLFFPIIRWSTTPYVIRTIGMKIPNISVIIIDLILCNNDLWSFWKEKIPRTTKSEIPLSTQAIIGNIFNICK